MNKAYILDEIKRTAATNGGMPLGRERFFNETGIRPPDWNKYWVRWGDVIREAGFEPNQLQTAYAKGELLETFISLMRELGRFPVNAEVKMKARRTKGFPSHTAFSRFGHKQDLAAIILEYCKTRQGYEDVAEMTEAVVRHAGGVTDGEENGDRVGGDDLGFVYLMKSGRYYKLGRSNAFGRREREITLQLPEKATTVHTIRTDDPAGIEAYWHRRFEERRRNGEWFELSGEDVRAFRRRKFM